MRYEVVDGDLEVAKADLCRLWSDNLHLASSPDMHFRRVFAEAPEPSRALVLRAHSRDGDMQIVGANSITARAFQLGSGVEGRAAISGDFVVDVAHRSLLPALQLSRAVRDCMARDFDLGFGFPNPKAHPVLVRAGFKVLGTVTRHVRVLRHGAYLPAIAARLNAPRWLSRVANHPRAEALLGPLVDFARLAHFAPQAARARTYHRLEWCESADERFDALWSRARSEYEVIGARTAAVLRWRYPRCMLAASVREDGALAAYAIVDQDRETNVAYLRDVFGHKSELGTLVDLLMPELYLRGATSISIRFLGAPYLLAELGRRGFEARPDVRMIVVQVGSAREALRTSLEDPTAWHLFDLDEDT